MKKKSLYLIDGFGLIFRNFFALQATRMKTKSGFPTNAIYGFMTQVVRLIENYSPSYVAVVFDSKEKTFRHDMNPEYKANRPPAPEELIMQIGKIQELLQAYQVATFSLSKYEADDIIGTIATRFQNDCEVFIVSSDKDFSQLISPTIKMLKPGKEQEFDLFGESDVEKTYGVSVAQFIDYLTMIGDASDNVKGVPGVGPKTAAKLLSSYGSLENIYKNISKETANTQKKFEEAKPYIDLSKQLITIHTSTPIPFHLEEMLVKEPNKEMLLPLLKELEMKQMLSKIESKKDDAFQLVSEQVERKNDEVKLSTNLEREYHLVNTEATLNEVCDKLKNQSNFAFDTETTSLNVYQADIVVMSFSFKEKNDIETYVVYLPSFTKEVIVEKFAPIFSDEKILKIGQNIKYDIGVLRTYGIHLKGNLFDTMLASYVLNPDSKHNMDDMALRHLNILTIKYEELVGKGKNQKSIYDVPIEKLVRYAGQDAFVTYSLYEILKNELEQNHRLYDVCLNVEFPLIYTLLRMEERGIAIDKPILKEISNKLKIRAIELQDEIIAEAQEPFNLDSPKQLGEVLFGKLQIPTAQKTKTGFSTNAQVLEELEDAYPIVKNILTYRKLKKLITTYVDTLPELIEPTTGMLHTSFNQSIAATGRLSSINPNLQNIPIRSDEGKEIRNAFIARKKENVLVSADYSQIELRVAAELSGDTKMIDDFKQNVDIHTATAQTIFHTTTITREMRNMAKTINFGVLYGMQTHSLSKRLGITFGESKDVIAKYKQSYVRLFEFMNEILQYAKTNGYVETIIGRRRYINDLNVSNFNIRNAAERAAINSPIQGTAADLIKIAMLNIDKRIMEEKLQSLMLLQVHDELVFEVPTNELDTLFILVKKEMIDAAKQIGMKTTPIEVEIKQGKSWLEAH